MSFTEILEEIPRLTAEQRCALMLRLQDVGSSPASTDKLVLDRSGEWAVLVGNRVIRHEEVRAILADFP